MGERTHPGESAARGTSAEAEASPWPTSGPMAPGEAARRARASWARVRDDVASEARARLDRRDAAAFLARAERAALDGLEPLARLFGERTDPEALFRRLLAIALEATAERSEELRGLDHRREVTPDWFLEEQMVGYVCYADRFAGTLRGVGERVGYLRELGVQYLHLMPLLKPRPGPNDGGYAVADYRSVDPRLGSMDDLEALAGDLRRHGISLCVDLVVNHTAAEHPWARAAVEGDPHYRGFYLTFPDRALPDAYEATLPEVFPDTAPGSFTWSDELDAWVWTTFYPYQWDLDHANPDVFAALLGEMCHLANRGVEILRLDAVPFTWKRLGTNCQNQPEAHLLLQAWRALVRVAAPAVAFKAEAIVPPGELVQYLGAHTEQGADGTTIPRVRPECDLAYHNQLMVMGWSAVAARDAVLPTIALSRMRRPPQGTGWCTYVRCHDDIGWAVDDADAAAAGLNGFAHRRFLADFYAGRFPGSFARGEPYQSDPDTGDERTSGTAAALAGIDQARELGDPRLLDMGIRRLLLLYAIVFGWGGIPLVYMGDELALPNDEAWTARSHGERDNRWLHRPPMDWDAAGRRDAPDTVEGRVFAGFRRLVAARRMSVALHGGGDVEPLWVDDPRVLAWRRIHPRFGALLGLANVDDHPHTVDAGVLARVPIPHPVDALANGAPLDTASGRIDIPPLTARWIIEG